MILKIFNKIVREQDREGDLLQDKESELYAESPAYVWSMLVD